jgi:hypothetical protein
VLALEAVFLLYLLSEHGMDLFKPPYCIFIPLFLGATIKWAAASQAVRPMVEQRRQDSLELLLATPLPVSQIIKGANDAMLKAFLPSLRLCLAIDLFFMVVSCFSVMNGPHNALELSVTIWCFIAGMAFVPIDYYAIVSLAMWHGISSKKPVNAAGTAVFGILLLPWLLWYGSIIFYFVLLRNLAGPGPDPHWFLGYWVCIGFSVSFLFGATSRVNLQNRFRQCALQRFQPEKPGVFERLMRFFRPTGS